MPPLDLESRLKTVDNRHPTDRTPGWWATKCLDCNTWLTKFDESKEESRRMAENLGHRCQITTL